MFFEAFVIFLIIAIFLILKRNTIKNDSDIFSEFCEDCIFLVEETEIEEETKKKFLEFLGNSKFKKLITNTIIDLKIEGIKHTTLESNKDGIYIIAEYKSSLNNEIKTLKIVYYN